MGACRFLKLRPLQSRLCSLVFLPSHLPGSWNRKESLVTHITGFSVFFCDSFWCIFQVNTFGEDTGSSAGKESACNEGDPGLIPGLGRAPGEGIGYPLRYSWASCGSAGKESACGAGLGRSLGEGKGYPLQYSGVENSVDCIVHGVTKSWT